jgi:hypothetical protein
MELGRAFSYAFEDKDWITKLGIAVLMMMATLIPIVGLLAVCVLLGYMANIVHNVRNGHPRPLPKWGNYSHLAKHGAYVLLATILYNLPVLFIMAFLNSFGAAMGRSQFGGFAYVTIIGCVLLILFVYTMIAWSMLAIGIIRYSEKGDTGVFYRFAKLFNILQNNISLTLKWVFYSIIANILFAFLFLIPIVGWAVVLALSYPVQGYLMGQYGRMIGVSKTAKRDGRI